MPALPLRQSRLVLAAAALALVAGCGSFDGTGRRLSTALTPYKVEVVQGNFVSREQVEALQKGMTAEQVRNVLGTPLVTSRSTAIAGTCRHAAPAGRPAQQRR